MFTKCAPENVPTGISGTRIPGGGGDRERLIGGVCCTVVCSTEALSDNDFEEYCFLSGIRRGVFFHTSRRFSASTLPSVGETPVFHARVFLLARTAPPHLSGVVWWAVNKGQDGFCSDPRRAPPACGPGMASVIQWNASYSVGRPGPPDLNTARFGTKD